MKLNFFNPIGGIVVASNLNHADHCIFWKIVKIELKKNLVHKILGRCYSCLQKKTLHNYQITNPNGMNQNLSYT